MKCFVVDSEIIRRNIETVKEKAGVPVWGVIKGDGYGMGLVFMARMLKECGITRFAVTEPQDALRLRGEGFLDEEILVMRSTCVKEDVKIVVDARAIATVGSKKSAEVLNEIARKSNAVAKAHVKIDTGMGRYGFLTSELELIKSVYTDYKNIEVSGIYSHLCRAATDEKKTKKQLEEFEQVIKRLEGEGINPRCAHIANSAALFRYDGVSQGCVRIGYALVGRVQNAKNSALKSTGHLQCEIAETKWLPKGYSLGYGNGFVTRRKTRIGVVPVGVKDGFMVGKQRDTYGFRDFVLYILSESKKFLAQKKIYVQVNGKNARVLGHVGQGHTTIDLTDIEAEAGDLAIFDINSIYVNPAIKRVYI